MRIRDLDSGGSGMMQRRTRSAAPHRLSGLSPSDDGEGENSGDNGIVGDVPPLRQAFAPMLGLSSDDEDDSQGKGGVLLGNTNGHHGFPGLSLRDAQPGVRSGDGARGGGQFVIGSLATRLGPRLPPDSSILAAASGQPQGPWTRTMPGPPRIGGEGNGGGGGFHLPVLPPTKLSSSGSAHSYPSRPSTAQSVQSVLSNASFGSQISVSSAMAALGGGGGGGIGAAGGGGTLSRSDSLSSSVSFAASTSRGNPSSGTGGGGGGGVGGGSGSGGRGSVPVIPLVLPRIMSGRVCVPEGGGGRGAAG